MDENDKEIERILADPNTEIRYEPYFRESTSTEDNEDSGKRELRAMDESFRKSRELKAH